MEYRILRTSKQKFQAQSRSEPADWGDLAEPSDNYFAEVRRIRAIIGHDVPIRRKEEPGAVDVWCFEVAA